MTTLLDWRMGAAILGLVVLAGCGSSPEPRSTTTGRELMDLNQALKSGAIDWEEYSEQKEAILERSQ